MEKSLNCIIRFLLNTPTVCCVEGAPAKKRKLDESEMEKKESDETEGKEEEVAAEEETKPAEEEKADEETAVPDRCNEAWFKHILAFPHPSKYTLPGSFRCFLQSLLQGNVNE